jgi:hypothetical protein
MDIKLKSKLLKDNLLDKIYLGEVVDINDEGIDGNPIFRVKVKVFGLTDLINKDLLPWYIVKHGNGQTLNLQGNIPQIGTKVFVEFPDKSIYNGIVSFQIPNTPPKLKG